MTYVIIKEETKFSFNEYNLLHCVTGPAILYSNGNEEWWVDGTRHRNDGPAATFFDKKYWYINGNNISDNVNEWLIENNITYPFSQMELMLFQLTFL